MEILRPDSDEVLTPMGENDQFYEEIEAPKFVDFTVPDRSKPDDKYWFCLRIGCDQQHEEVDPDALYRSFMLRVMAARSPNIKYQKALNKHAPRSIRKCPQTAPAKSVKDRVSRMSTSTSIPDRPAYSKLKSHPVVSLRSTPTNTEAKSVKDRVSRMSTSTSIPDRPANSKLKSHPVFSLRSTPTNTEAKVQALRSEKKALSTPRTKKCPSIHDPFLSVNRQKAPVPVSKNGSMAKALFLGTPKKTDEACKLKLLNPQVCDGMKKLNICSLKKKTVEVRLSGKKFEETSCTSLKKKNEGVVNTKNVDDSKQKTQALVVDNIDENDGVVNTKNVDDSKQKTQALVVDNIDENDGNKENDSSTGIANSSTTNSEKESRRFESNRFESNENIPQKQMRAASKNSQEHGNQAAKFKRTTNPKPFRLRTNERGILKEANLEMKMKLEAQKEQKESASVHRHEKHHNTTHEKKNQFTSERQESQSNQMKTPRVRYVKSRYASSIHKCHKAEGKKPEESQNNIVKTASSRQNLRAKSERSERTAEVSKVKLASKPAVEDNIMANVTFLKGKNPSATQKESNFRRLQAPKSCTKRQGKVMA